MNVTLERRNANNRRKRDAVKHVLATLKYRGVEALVEMAEVGLLDSACGSGIVINKSGGINLRVFAHNPDEVIVPKRFNGFQVEIAKPKLFAREIVA